MSRANNLTLVKSLPPPRKLKTAALQATASAGNKRSFGLGVEKPIFGFADAEKNACSFVERNVCVDEVLTSG